MTGIFISYRREDTAAYAGWLCQTLKAHFGEDQLFRDIDNIGPGERFPKVIEEALSTCDVLIALIGKHWLTVADDGGRQRLENPHDYVRGELTAALRRDDVLVIPVLLDGTAMPEPQDLPEPLRALTDRNALNLDSVDWEADVARLIAAIERIRARGGQTSLGAAAEAVGVGGTAASAVTAGERVPAAYGDQPTAPVTRPADLETGAPSRSRSSKIRLGAAAASLVVVALVGGAVLTRGGPSSAVPAAPTTVTTAGPLPETTLPTVPPTVRPTVPPPTTPTTTRPATTTTARPATTTTPIRPDTCKVGFVWREARPTDHVCVTPDVRTSTQNENAQAPSRWVTGPYGPHTCVDGFVWREAFVGDDVCVTPAIRAQTASDNAQAPSRRVSAG